jgi:hypothetical protein
MLQQPAAWIEDSEPDAFEQCSRESIALNNPFNNH